jgi:hypothetical protein
VRLFRFKTADNTFLLLLQLLFAAFDGVRAVKIVENLGLAWKLAQSFKGH